MQRKTLLAALLVAAAIAILWPRKVALTTPETGVAESRRDEQFLAQPSPASQPQPTQTFATWLTAWQSGAASIEEGKQLAQTRRDHLKRLMRDNPRQAWAESLSWSDWRSLPEEIRALTERPFSDRVDLSVRPVCKPLDPTIPPLHTHRVLLNNEWKDAHVFGRREDARSKEGLPVRGFELDGQVVLSEHDVEPLTGPDQVAASELFPTETNGQSWLTGQPATHQVLLGGRIYDLASEQEVTQLNTFLTNVENSKHPKAMAFALAAGAGAGTIKFDLAAAEEEIIRASSTWTETVKRAIALRISYSSAPNDYSYVTETDLRNIMVGVSNAVKVMSFGKTSLEITVVSVTLPNSYQYYQDGGPDTISADTRARLIAMGYNRSNYDFATHAHPQHNFAYAGLGQIGAGDCWLNGNQGLNVTTHEIGHNYGLGHAHYVHWLTGNGTLGRTNPDGSAIEREEYGDPYDIMGGGGWDDGHFGAYGKAALNWIEPREVLTVTTNGIYRIHRFDHPDARVNQNNRLALRIYSPGGEEFWVSHRKEFTANANLARGAFIVKADGGSDQSLVDATPLSRPGAGPGSDKDDAGLAVGKSFTDPHNTVKITTINAAGVAPQEYIDVQVTFTEAGAAYEFFTDGTRANRGLTGSFVNRSLRTVSQADWRTGQVISGRRIDRFLSFHSNGWGARAPVGITGGTDADWENFSVQWDGVIVVNRPIRLATVSDDGSRFWIDTNNNATFSLAELVNNNWGNGQGPTRGTLSGIIRPGAYPIRIQYEEGNGGNAFWLTGAELPFEFFTTETATTPGLVGSYVATGLRNATAVADWRVTQAIAGTRTDAYPAFAKNGWGALTAVGLTAANGADDNWQNFSVQWDGWLSNSAPIRIATASDDYSRIQLDVNGDGTFSALPPEYINNGWGGANGQGSTIGAVSQTIPPGMRRVRIQYEEGGGDNSFVFLGAPPVAVDAGILLGFTTFAGTDNRSITRRGTNDFTIQFWMRSSQIAGGDNEWTDGMGLVDASVVGAGRDFGVTLGNGRVLFGVGGASPVTVRSYNVADNQWHHVSARRERATGALTLFIDGVRAASGTGGTEALDEGPAMRAASLANNTRFFIGTLDQVRIWDTARTDQEIFADYHLSHAAHGLVADASPTVKILQLQPTSMQVYWDALSNFRLLQSANSPDGPWSTLATDQTSTNIPMGAIPRRYFRVTRP